MGSRGIGNSTAASNALEVAMVDPTTGTPFGSGNPVPVSGTFSASLGAFAPSAQASLAASTTSARQAVSSGGTLVVYNPSTTVTAYVLLGGSSVTVTTTTGMAVLPGEKVALATGTNTYLAAITASGTTTLALTSGTGLPAFAETASGGSTSVASVGTAGSAAPGSADEMGGVDSTGALRALGAAIFHNTDNQALGAASYGLLSGGVAQVVNAPGNLDRQRETGFDNAPPAGIAAGAQQCAVPFATTVAASVTAGARTVTPAAMSFMSRGVTVSIQTGSVLLIDAAGTAEFVFVTSVTSTTFSATFASNHSAGFTVAGFSFNQARDASIPDLSSPAGIAASMEYLWNAAANSGAGGVEAARSAAGELDGASGTGTSIAAEYGYNGGGPLTNSGVPSQLSFDRDRNLQGKGRQTTTLNGATSAGATSITLTAVAGLLPGSQIIVDAGAATEEAAYVAQSYTVGSTTVALQSTLAQAHSNGVTVAWDVFASHGPGTNGINATGIEVAEDVVYDPTTKLFYATLAMNAGDGVAATNVELVGPGVYNGSTVDRVRSASSAQGTTGTGVPAAGAVGIYNSSPPALSSGQMGQLQLTSSGYLLVSGATPLGIGYIAPNTQNNTNGATTLFKFLSAANTTPVQVGGTGYRHLYGGHVANFATANRFLKIYASSSAPTVGTTTPVMTITLPAAASGGASAVNLADVFGAVNATIASGCWIAITGGVADTDNTAGSAGDVLVNLVFA